MSAARDSRYLVLVRYDSDEGYEAYGVYGSLGAAERKAAAINKRLQLHPERGDDSGAWAYVMRLVGGTTPASVIADSAFGEDE